MNILLDLDETLIRKSEARDRAALEFFKHFSSILPLSQIEFLIQWQSLIERHFRRFTNGEISFQEHRRERMRELFSAHETNLSTDELDSRFEVYLTHYEKNWTLFEDVLPFLNRARHCRLGIVTNGESKQQRDKLRLTGILNFFHAVIISSEVGSAKPEAKIFLEASRVLGVSPNDCIFIGDRIDLDIEGSRAIGMNAIWLNRSGSIGGNSSFRTVKSLHEIEIKNAEK